MAARPLVLSAAVALLATMLLGGCSSGAGTTGPPYEGPIITTVPQLPHAFDPTDLRGYSVNISVPVHTTVTITETDGNGPPTLLNADGLPNVLTVLHAGTDTSGRPFITVLAARAGLQAIVSQPRTPFHCSGHDVACATGYTQTVDVTPS